MANFKSDKVTVNGSAQKVFEKLSDLSNIVNLLENAPVDQIPEEHRDTLQKISFSENSISFPAGPVGDVTLQVKKREPFSLIELEGVGTPVPLSLSLNIEEVSENECRAYVAIDLAIPAMLKPMISSPMQKMTDQFSQVLKAIKF